MVAAVLGQSGAAGFDCASVPEIQLALQSTAGSSSTTNKATAHGNNQLCVYANPQRAEKDLDIALGLSVRALTFDGPEELRKVHRAYQKQVEQQQHTFNNSKDDSTMIARPDLILRIVVPDENSSVPLGEKFGASPSRFLSLIELAVEFGLRIVGVSFHCGSGNHDPTAYQVAIELAGEAMEIVDRVQQEAGIEEKCWLLDIGGGYPGKDGVGGDCGRFVGSDSQESAIGDETVDEATEDSETTVKIADIVTPLLDELYPVDSSHVQVISEPGRYFVESAFALCSRIYRVVVDPESGHRHYYIAQGVQGVFKDCVLCGESFLPIPLALESPSDGESAASVVPSTVHGPSGEDYDIICRDHPLPVLQAGDWLIFDRMGAYTLSIAARNGRPPVRYLMGGSTLSRQ
jgi:ornithine decarboxylase